MAACRGRPEAPLCHLLSEHQLNQHKHALPPPPSSFPPPLPPQVTNMLFRMGAAAVLLSNKKSWGDRAKYSLVRRRVHVLC